jgi:predicted lysophospholipase L1 biosynthesis ABC-type transport system permease subunit
VSVTLAVFGGLAAISLLVVFFQLVGRQLRRRADELTILRALGAGPAMIAGDAVTGIILATVIGCLIAVGVAAMLSPLFPLGPVRSVVPTSVALDLTALGLGFAALVIVLTAVAIATAVQQIPRRTTLATGRDVRRPSQVAELATGAGLPTSAVMGIRFAIEPGHRDPVPVRSAILGSAVAVVVVLATVVFASSLNNLVTHPPLYGWNWNYALLSGFSGDEDLPAHQTAALLEHDRFVTAATGVYFAKVSIDGQVTSSIGAPLHASVGPTLLSGHGLAGPHEIVLGPSTMDALGKRLGQTVEFDSGSAKPVRLVIVGTATMPAIVGGGLGKGAVVDYRLIPPSVRNTQGSQVPGPNAFLVRTTGPPKQALRSLEAITAAINAPSSRAQGQAGGPVGVLRPEEIVDSHSIVVIPAALGGTLAVGAAIALATTLVASVRRRRRDLAVLRIFGFSGRQLGSIMAWQSTITVVIGTIIGVPVGLLVGNLLWTTFAEAIDAVPVTSVPVPWVVAIVVGALVMANVVAAAPARLAAHTRTAVLLRAAD